jgi:hypothetical protein
MAHKKTEYGKFLSHNGKEIRFEHVVHYDKGITSDHVIASGSYPVNFDFAKIEVESQRSSISSNRSINRENTTNKTGNSYNYIRDEIFLRWRSHGQYSINAVGFAA